MDLNEKKHVEPIDGIKRETPPDLKGHSEDLSEVQGHGKDPEQIKEDNEGKEITPDVLLCQKRQKFAEVDREAELWVKKRNKVNFWKGQGDQINATKEDYEKNENPEYLRKKEEYLEALKEYRNTKLKELDEQGLSDEEKEDRKKEIFRETLLLEANELHEAKLEAALNEKPDPLKEKAKNIGKNAGKWYRGLPLRRKLAISAGLLGLGVGAGALGGTAGVALASSHVLLSGAQRALSGAATAVGLEGLIKKSQEKKTEKEMSEFFAKSLEEKLTSGNAELDNKLFELEGRKKGERYRRYILAGTAGVLVGSGAVGKAFSSVAEFFGENKEDILGKMKAFISPSEAHAQNIPSDEVKEVGTQPESSSLESEKDYKNSEKFSDGGSSGIEFHRDENGKILDIGGGINMKTDNFDWRSFINDSAVTESDSFAISDAIDIEDTLKRMKYYEQVISQLQEKGTLKPDEYDWLKDSFNEEMSELKSKYGKFLKTDKLASFEIKEPEPQEIPQMASEEELSAEKEETQPEDVPDPADDLQNEDPKQDLDLDEPPAPDDTTVEEVPSYNEEFVTQIEAGDSVWDITEAKLDELGYFDNLSKIQKEYLTAQVLERIAEDPEQFGMEGVDDIDVVQPGQKLDLSTVLANEEVMEKMLSSSRDVMELVREEVETSEKAPESQVFSETEPESSISEPEPKEPEAPPVPKPSEDILKEQEKVKSEPAPEMVSQEADTETFEKLEPEKETDTKIQFEDPTETYVAEVKESGSVWKAVEEKIGSHFEGFDNFNEAQKTYLLDAIKDKIAEDPDRFGMEGVDNIDIVQSGQRIDLSTIMKEEEAITRMFESASNLSNGDIDRIIENNQKIAEWVRENPSELLTSDKVEEIISGEAIAEEGFLEGVKVREIMERYGISEGNEETVEHLLSVIDSTEIEGGAKKALADLYFENWNDDAMPGDKPERTLKDFLGEDSLNDSKVSKDNLEIERKDEGGVSITIEKGVSEGETKEFRIDLSLDGKINADSGSEELNVEEKRLDKDSLQEVKKTLASFIKN
ncbi:MAG: hypothetical protein ACLFNR_01545 [Candidatus Paceibacterota bacterium]